MGEHDTTTDPDCQNLGEGRECAEPVQDVAVAQAIWHAQFDTPIKWANDIGLIRMARRVNLETGERTQRQRVNGIEHVLILTLCTHRQRETDLPARDAGSGFAQPRHDRRMGSYRAE